LIKSFQFSFGERKAMKKKIGTTLGFFFSNSFSFPFFFFSFPF